MEFSDNQQKGYNSSGTILSDSGFKIHHISCTWSVFLDTV